jgi:hypothetical protein
MNYLDQTGLEYLWGKIKTYAGTAVDANSIEMAYGSGPDVIFYDDTK